GVDVSAANIRAAQTNCPNRTARGVRFVEADYLTYVTAPVHVIVTDGVLHLIGGDTARLFHKLANDLVPGGIVVCAMPYDCRTNRVLAAVRRALRAVRSPATDAAILFAARALHGREMTVEHLRERVKYMYMAPTRVIDRRLIAEIAPSVGLRLAADYPMKRTSGSQLRHKIVVFERIDNPARGLGADA